MAWEISFYAPADIGNYIYTGWLSGGIVKNSTNCDGIMIYIVAPHNENVYYLVATHVPITIKLGDINSYWTIRSSNLHYISTVDNIPERFVNFIHNSTVNKSSNNLNSLDGLNIFINAYRNTEHLRLKNSIITRLEAIKAQQRKQIWDRLLNLATKQDLTVARNNINFNYSNKYRGAVEDYNRIKTFIK